MIVEPAEQLVTVFGGGGFIGRYVCERLLKAGARVRVASREPRRAHFIQPLGQVGQWGLVQVDLGDSKSVRAAVEGATAVINLCGVLKGAFTATHVDGARNVAEAARDSGSTSLVHVSAIGADPGSESAYGRTKGEGEAAVQAIFPKATIIRPSIVFGPEDLLTNRIAALAVLPVLPVLAAKRKFQPVFVRDVAQAIASAALDPQRHGGRTYEVGGPQVLSMRELYEEVLKAAGRQANIVELPDVAGSFISAFGFFPGAPITRDQWLMLQRDNVPAEGAAGLEAFGIKPTALGAIAPGWLGRFGGSRFVQRRVNMTATS